MISFRSVCSCSTKWLVSTSWEMIKLPEISEKLSYLLALRQELSFDYVFLTLPYFRDKITQVTVAKLL